MFAFALVLFGVIAIGLSAGFANLHEREIRRIATHKLNRLESKKDLVSKKLDEVQKKEAECEDILGLLEDDTDRAA
jgi:predicted transporter